jgi:C4-dicarboxylate-specific signal transduction histidine kinase
VIAVSDTGEPLPEDIAANLFKRALPSQQGLGVGLYQAFNLAQKAQLSLRLAVNQPGEVRFEFGNLVEFSG